MLPGHGVHSLLCWPPVEPAELRHEDQAMRGRHALEVAGLCPPPGCLMGPGQPLRSPLALTAAVLQLLRGAEILGGLLGAGCCCTSMPPASSGCGGPCPTPAQPCWAAQGCGTGPMPAACLQVAGTAACRLRGGSRGHSAQAGHRTCTSLGPQGALLQAAALQAAAGADGLAPAAAAEVLLQVPSAGCGPVPAAGAVPQSCCLLLLSWSSGGCW